MAHGALESFVALRKAGIKVAIVSNWDTRLPLLLEKLGFGVGERGPLDAVIVSAEEYLVRRCMLTASKRVLHAPMV